MKVCIDIQSAITQCAGIGRYTRLLVQNLALEADSDDSLLLFYFDFKRRAVSFQIPRATHKTVRWCPGRLARFAWKSIGWPGFDAFAGKADVYHFPNFVLPPLNRGKSAVTIHDVSFLRFPEFTEDRNLRYLRSRIRDTVARADAIITGSDFSAREIEELFNVAPTRIFYVYHGISEDLAAPNPAETTAVLKAMGIDRPYILSVGTIEPRKNIPFLIEVFEKLTDFDGCLVIAGALGWKYEPILERMRTSPRSADIRYVNFVNDIQLPALYAGAQAFVFPSLYEGFGFPPLEAMACGAPVISSTKGSLAEVLGAGAALVDAFDSDQWAHEVKKTITDTERRTGLIAEGRRRAAAYTWAETARKTWTIYKELAR